MRRKEFEVDDTTEITNFLHEMSFGFLGTIGQDGYSRVTPLNFAYGNEVFYFHGSLAGEKMKHLKQNDKVSFTVAKEFSLIPSYFSDPVLACPATSYFKCVMVCGTAVIVDDVQEKAHAFTLFMNKLQPEGGYEPIDANDPRYIGQLKAVSVFKLIPERLTAKFKFGQNLSDKARNELIDALQQRNEGDDPRTVQEMIKHCPYSN